MSTNEELFFGNHEKTRPKAEEVVETSDEQCFLKEYLEKSLNKNKA